VLTIRYVHLMSSQIRVSVLSEKLAVVDEYLVYHCWKYCNVSSNSGGMRPIVLTIDALYTAVDLAFITDDDTKCSKMQHILLVLLFNFVMHCIILTIVVAFEINYLISSYLIIDFRGGYHPSIHPSIHPSSIISLMKS